MKNGTPSIYSLVVTIPSSQPPTMDPVAAACWQRTAPAAAPWLHEEIASRMLDRLDWIKRTPAQWVHWGAVRGGLQTHLTLAKRYPKSHAFIVEPTAKYERVASEFIAKPWWHPERWRGAQTTVAQPTSGSCDMLWANMQLHLSATPESLVAQWHAALAVEGFLMFSCLGPDTAREVHAVYSAMGWPAAGADLTDMHDWGDMLVQSGFAEPVMDMERITLTYDSPTRLLDELIDIGRNLHPRRFPSLRGRGWRPRLEQALAERGPRDTSGRLTLTFEVIYGHALKAAPRVKVSTLSSVSVNDMRSMLQQPRKNSQEKP